jgi:hypothetical protein
MVAFWMGVVENSRVGGAVLARSERTETGEEVNCGRRRDGAKSLPKRKLAMIGNS